MTILEKHIIDFVSKQKRAVTSETIINYLSKIYKNESHCKLLITIHKLYREGKLIIVNKLSSNDINNNINLIIKGLDGEISGTKDKKFKHHKFKVPKTCT